MKAVRWVAAAAVAVVAALAVDRIALRPCRCDMQKQAAQKELLRIYDLPSTPRVMSAAREGMETMAQCTLIAPTDVDMYMTLAAFQRVLGLRSEAATTYRRALQYDRRPELFLNIGLLDLEMNHRAAAMDPLTKACLFNINFINEIPEDMRDMVLSAVRAEQAAGVAAARRSGR